MIINSFGFVLDSIMFRVLVKPPAALKAFNNTSSNFIITSASSKIPFPISTMSFSNLII